MLAKLNICNNQIKIIIIYDFSNNPVNALYIRNED